MHKLATVAALAVFGACVSACAGFDYIVFALTCEELNGKVEAKEDGLGYYVEGFKCVADDGTFIIDTTISANQSYQEPLYPLSDPETDSTHETIITP